MKAGTQESGADPTWLTKETGRSGGGVEGTCTQPMEDGCEVGGKGGDAGICEGGGEGGFGKVGVWNRVCRLAHPPRPTQYENYTTPLHCLQRSSTLMKMQQTGPCTRSGDHAR